MDNEEKTSKQVLLHSPTCVNDKDTHHTSDKCNTQRCVMNKSGQQSSYKGGEHSQVYSQINIQDETPGHYSDLEEKNILDQICDIDTAHRSLDVENIKQGCCKTGINTEEELLSSDKIDNAVDDDDIVDTCLDVVDDIVDDDVVDEDSSSQMDAEQHTTNNTDSAAVMFMEAGGQIPNIDKNANLDSQGETTTSNMKLDITDNSVSISMKRYL